VAGANNWGGYRPGGGRPKGSRSSPMGRVKPPKEVCEAVIEAAKAELLSGKETALDIMERVMRGDTSITTEQFLAAKELAPYRFPKLSAVAVQPVPPSAQLTDAQLDHRLAELVGRLPSLLTVEEAEEAAVTVEEMGAQNGEAA
jgi:hypothetical protein